MVVVTYPQLFSSSAVGPGCGWLDEASRANFVIVGGALRNQIIFSAKAAGVEYVDATESLKGHELCTSDSWMMPVLPSGAFDSYSAHPAPRGQEAMAMAVEHYLALVADPDHDLVVGYRDACPTTPAVTADGCPAPP